jgi:hypothetical protein
MAKRGAPRRWGRTATGLYICTDCPKELKSRSAMYRHWDRHHRTESQRISRVKAENLCQFGFCDNPRHSTFPMCESHLTEQEEIARKRLSERIAITSDEDCFHWTGATTQRGYGQGHAYGLYFGNRERAIGAHVLSLYLFNRSDDDNPMSDVALHEYGHVHHSCDNRDCVNPQHLTEISSNLHWILHQMDNPRILTLVLDHIEEIHPEGADILAELKGKILP